MFIWDGDWGWQHRLVIESINRKNDSWPLTAACEEKHILMLGFVRPKEVEILKARIAQLEAELRMAKDAYLGVIHNLPALYSQAPAGTPSPSTQSEPAKEPTCEAPCCACGKPEPVAPCSACIDQLCQRP